MVSLNLFLICSNKHKLKIRPTVSSHESQPSSLLFHLTLSILPFMPFWVWNDKLTISSRGRELWWIPKWQTLLISHAFYGSGEQSENAAPGSCRFSFTHAGVCACIQSWVDNCVYTIFITVRFLSVENQTWQCVCQTSERNLSLPTLPVKPESCICMCCIKASDTVLSLILDAFF